MTLGNSSRVQKEVVWMKYLRQTMICLLRYHVTFAKSDQNKKNEKKKKM